MTTDLFSHLSKVSFRSHSTVQQKAKREEN
jgi:hypothetical protein